MRPEILQKSLEAVSPLIAEIIRIAGVAGLSLGVLHGGDVIHCANFGYRDLSRKIPPDENTTYVIGSLTKAFTTSLLGLLVEDRKLRWDTQLRHVAPEYYRADAAADITMVDLLSHRTGLPPQDGLWLLSDGVAGINLSQVIPILNAAPLAASVRSEFIYNNLAYAAIGTVIERKSETEYAQLLRKRILEPLGMEHTYFTDIPADAENSAKPYACLLNRTQVEIAQPLAGKNVTVGAAGGVRSSVRDLLRLYGAYIDAATVEFGTATSVDSNTFATRYPAGNPLMHAQLSNLWGGKMTLGMPVLREHSYALGWTRAELPGLLGLFERADGHVVGRNKSSQLVMYHQGNIPGFYAFAAILPEGNGSAVVVLANSRSLADVTKLIGSILIEILSDNPVNNSEFLSIAERDAKRGATIIADVMRRLEEGRRVHEPPPASQLAAYVGTYWNTLHNFHIDIKIGPETGKLQVAFMGREEDTFDLEPYRKDSFFWQMTHDECSRRARLTEFPPNYYILTFGCPGSNPQDLSCLIWKFDDYIPQGEVFRRSTPSKKWLTRRIDGNWAIGRMWDQVQLIFRFPSQG